MRCCTLVHVFADVVVVVVGRVYMESGLKTFVIQVCSIPFLNIANTNGSKCFALDHKQYIFPI